GLRQHLPRPDAPRVADHRRPVDRRDGAHGRRPAAPTSGGRADDAGRPLRHAGAGHAAHIGPTGVMLRAVAVVAVGAAGGLGLACAGSGAAAVPHPESAVAVVESSGCQAVSERATGWFGPGGLVITVAHAVRGSSAVAVDGAATRVVALDVRAD